MLANNATKLATKSAVVLCVDLTANCDVSMNHGNVCANIHQIASVCARCCSHAPFCMKKAASVGATSNATPAYHE